MKLAVVTMMRGASWGGSEELWYRAVLVALREGWKVHVTCFPNVLESEQIGRLRDAGVEVAALKWLEGTSAGVRAWWRMLPPLRAARAFGPDVVVVNNGATYEWTEIPGVRQAVREWRQGGARVYMLCHGNHEGWMPDAWQAGLVREVWPALDGVGFCTPVFRELTERQMLMAIGNGFVFKNPVNLASREPVAWPGGKTARFAMVCRLDIHKGVDVALRVLAGAQWKGRDWTLDVYGDGVLREYLEALARHMGHDEGRVRFRGATSDVRAVWGENQVMLLPSRIEGLPLTVVEAAMCGRVVVATDVGGVKAWCEQAGAGYVAAAPTVGAVGEAMERAWSERERWEEMGRRAREYALGWYGKGPELELMDRLAGAQVRSSVVECPQVPTAGAAAGA